MRDERNAAEDSAARLTTTVPWTVAAVSAMTGYRLRVSFVDGTMGEVDLSPLILSARAGVFLQLRRVEAFEQVRVSEGVVSWPGDLDLAPDAMYDAIRSAGRWVVE